MDLSTRSNFNDMNQPKKPSHGGPRKGAGRPETGRKHYTVTIKPKEMIRWKKAAKAKLKSVGELMEETEV